MAQQRRADYAMAKAMESLAFAGDLEPFGVFADWLQERGDPWGQLVAIDYALEKSGDDAALVAERTRILAEHGPNICSLHSMPGVAITYQRGFIRVVQFGDCSKVKPAALAELVTDLLWSPVTLLLDELSFEDCNLDGQHANALLPEKRLHRLRTINFSGNKLSAGMQRQIRQTFKNAHVGESRRVRDARLGEAMQQPLNHHRAFIRAQGGPRSIDDYDD